MRGLINALGLTGQIMCPFFRTHVDIFIHFKMLKKMHDRKEHAKFYQRPEFHGKLLKIM